MRSHVGAESVAAGTGRSRAAERLVHFAPNFGPHGKGVSEVGVIAAGVQTGGYIKEGFRGLQRDGRTGSFDAAGGLRGRTAGAAGRHLGRQRQSDEKKREDGMQFQWGSLSNGRIWRVYGSRRVRANYHATLSVNGDPGIRQQNTSGNRKSKHMRRLKDGMHHLIPQTRFGIHIARTGDHPVVVDPPLRIHLRFDQQRPIGRDFNVRRRTLHRVHVARCGETCERCVVRFDRRGRGNGAQQAEAEDQKNDRSNGNRRLNAEGAQGVVAVELPAVHKALDEGALRVGALMGERNPQPDRQILRQGSRARSHKGPLHRLPFRKLCTAAGAGIQVSANLLHLQAIHITVEIEGEAFANRCADIVHRVVSFCWRSRACRSVARPRSKRLFTVPIFKFKISAISSYCMPSISRRISTDRKASGTSRKASSTRARVSDWLAHSKGESRWSASESRSEKVSVSSSCEELSISIVTSCLR